MSAPVDLDLATTTFTPLDRLPRVSFIQTDDGNVLVHDPDLGVISAPTREAAEAELRRRKARAAA